MEKAKMYHVKPSLFNSPCSRNTQDEYPGRVLVPFQVSARFITCLFIRQCSAISFKTQALAFYSGLQQPLNALESCSSQDNC